MNTSIDSEIAQRHARRLATLEVQVAELEQDARRTRAYGPILLLVLANVTPLVIADARNDVDEAFTLFQGARGALPGSGPAEGWFLLLALAGLVLGAAGVLFSADRSAGFRRFVLASGTVMVVLLVAFATVAAAHGTKSLSYTALTPATALAAAAAVWLIVGARTGGRARRGRP